MAIWGALIGAGVGAYSANQNRNAASDAADLQAGAANRGYGLSERQFNIGQQNLAPWLRAGRAALDEQTALMGLGGDSAGALRSLQTSPGYQFRLNQGQNQLNSGLAARGGMGSGKGMAAGQRFAQGFASNEYGNRLAQLGGVQTQGLQTGNTLANLGSNYAVNQGNLLTGAANAQGAAGIAGANATQSGILGGLNAGLGVYNAMNAPNQNNTLSSLSSTPNWNQQTNDATWMQQYPYGQT